MELCAWIHWQYDPECEVVCEGAGHVVGPMRGIVDVAEQEEEEVMEMEKVDAMGAVQERLRSAQTGEGWVTLASQV
jgi:hypothetical protein